jgi:hypothetical protein
MAAAVLRDPPQVGAATSGPHPSPRAQKEGPAARAAGVWHSGALVGGDPISDGLLAGMWDSDKGTTEPGWNPHCYCREQSLR